MENLNKIAIIGGSGKAGCFVVQQLVNKGFQLKVLLRNPHLFEINNSLIEKVKGDVRDYETVHSLVEGCNVVISTLGQPKGENGLFSIAINHVIKAMNANSLKRYISITGITLEVEGDRKGFRTKILSKIMKMSFPAIIADKQNEFSILLESNLQWTVVRVPLIKQIESVGKVKVDLRDSPGKMISATDLADFLISQLSDDRYINKAPFIAN